MFSYVLTFIEGILTFISPCILPMLPIYFLYLAGASNTGASNEDDIQTSQKRKKLIINSFGFIIGFTVVFVMLGATITTFGRFLINQKDLLRQISGVVMVLFGLNFMGVITLKFLNVEKRINYKINKLGFLKSIVFGIVFGFGWTPCIGVFLGSALALASNSKTIVQGIMLLLVYSIGLGIPFIVSSIIFDKLEGTLKQIQKHSRLISIISGVLLVIAGILVFTDSLKYLNY